AAAVVAACVQRRPDDLSLLIAERSIPGTPWSAVVAGVGRRARGVGYHVDLADDDQGSARIINRAVAELARRRAHPEAARSSQPTWMVMISEADRVDALARRSDVYGFVDAPLGEQLGRLLDEGGEVGIHVLAAFASVAAARVVMADRRLRDGFRHRVAMQMSDDDSFAMVNSRAAARLQPDGPRPVAAVLFDRQDDRARTFKPYTLSNDATAAGGPEAAGEPSSASAGTFADQVDLVFDRLARRRRELVA
ncbi:MAG: hypothetical protein M3137_05155, partial [Actinomycetota bacterium]|nr:hypothetical protein [Actinomycetota bacterium]